MATDSFLLACASNTKGNLPSVLFISLLDQVGKANLPTMAVESGKTEARSNSTNCCRLKTSKNLLRSTTAFRLLGFTYLLEVKETRISSPNAMAKQAQTHTWAF
eukprot:scpid79791/ scgid15208/ 